MASYYLKFHGFVLILLIVFPYFIKCKCPNIVSRSQWGARSALSQRYLKFNPPPYIVIHHSAGPECRTDSTCKSTVKSIQDYHISSKGFKDIGYNFLVGDDGNVYEGRGWGIHGAHVPAYNARSIGICFLGNFQRSSPSEKQLETVQNLVSCGVELGKISPQYKLIGHRQGKSTECPGQTLFDIIKKWPHFEPNPN
ncbi:unnamed protein product [Brassicogethes aeneus]|uniref:Peptidoglycan-recognition protein n=1 Tax=Brassicogethes aeneus TaxID=1431903 RepID=A0A9P0AWN6_BRAAE|nr:unnamed protein product [Brassicogethes aeneus]